MNRQSIEGHPKTFDQPCPHCGTCIGIVIDSARIGGNIHNGASLLRGTKKFALLRSEEKRARALNRKKSR